MTYDDKDKIWYIWCDHAMIIMALFRQSIHQAWAQWALEAFLQRLLISTSADMLTRRHTGFPKDWHRTSFLETYSFRRARTPVLSLPVFFFFFTPPQQFSIECNIYLNIPVPSHSRLYHHVLEHLHSNDFRLHPDILLLSYTEGESEQPTVQTDLFWEYFAWKFYNCSVRMIC